MKDHFLSSLAGLSKVAAAMNQKKETKKEDNKEQVLKEEDVSVNTKK